MRCTCRWSPSTRHRAAQPTLRPGGGSHLLPNGKWFSSRSSCLRPSIRLPVRRRVPCRVCRPRTCGRKPIRDRRRCGERGGRSGLPGSCPGRILEHLHVAVGIAECCNRPAADVLIDANWLAGTVVNEVQLWKTYQHRFAVAYLEFSLDAAADDFLGRNAVDLVRPGSHKFDPSAGNDEIVEAIRAQIRHQFQHRLINHFCRQRPDCD